MNSGDIIALAEVIRELHRPRSVQIRIIASGSFMQRHSIAYPEKLALVEHITVEEAARELESIVKAGAGRKADARGKHSKMTTTLEQLMPSCEQLSP